MIRVVLAAVTMLVLTACQPSLRIDSDDPWASLHPWNHSWTQVETLPSGVEYIVIRKGEGRGPFPNPVDQVEVHYDGRFADSGEQFDTSIGGDTITFGLNGVIPGWTEGLQKMQPGDEFMFWIPWKMAYGEEGRGPIPPRSDLMFKVELFNVIPAVSADPAAWARATPWPTDNSGEVRRRPSGLEYLVIKSGDADEAPPTDRDFVYVHLEGRLEDGSLVDTTYETQAPLRFPMADLTPGWNELMKLMRPGDHWMVKMPPHLMYAEEGDGRIPPNATVIFEVRLDTVIRIDPPADEPPTDPADPR